MIQLNLDFTALPTTTPIPATKPQEKPYTLTPTKTGYRVVTAPGLTTAIKGNPCLDCKKFGKNMERCAEKCPKRLHYLSDVGMGMVSSITGEGSYGFGN